MKTLFLFTFLVSNLSAATDQTGTTAATFLKLGTGARSQAMGEAYVAISNDIDGLSYNPAGIASAISSLELTYNQWFQGVTSDHLGGIISFGEFGRIGGNINYLTIPSEPITQRIANTSDPTQNFQQIGSYSPYDTYATVSYAYSFSKKIDLGLSIKASGEDIDSKLGMGLGIDLGVIYKTKWDGLLFGMSIQNLGLPVTLVEDQFSLPMVIRGGVSYLTPIKDVLMSAEFDFPNDNQQVFAIGLEYKIENVFYPRFGYRIDGIFNPWSAGIGVQMGEARLDLTTVPYGELGQTYRASLVYEFGNQMPMTVKSVKTVEIPQKVMLESPRNAMLLTDKDTYVDIKTIVEPPDQVKSWSFFIYDRNERTRIIRKTGGSGSLPSDLTWDAKMDSGERATAGVYPAVLAVKFSNGKVVYSNFVKLTLSNISQLDIKP